MKTKITLSIALMVSSIAFANNTEITKEKEPTKISEIKRNEIVNNANQPIYFWEIKTLTGLASGYTNSEESARKTIKLMSTNDVVSSKIIERYKQ